MDFIQANKHLIPEYIAGLLSYEERRDLVSRLQKMKVQVEGKTQIANEKVGDSTEKEVASKIEDSTKIQDSTSVCNAPSTSQDEMERRKSNSITGHSESLGEDVTQAVYEKTEDNTSVLNKGNISQNEEEEIQPNSAEDSASKDQRTSASSNVKTKSMFEKMPGTLVMAEWPKLKWLLFLKVKKGNSHHPVACSDPKLDPEFYNDPENFKTDVPKEVFDELTPQKRRNLVMDLKGLFLCI